MAKSHPQNQVFRRLFPMPDDLGSKPCPLSKIIFELWPEQLHSDLQVTFWRLTSELPHYTPEETETGDVDYSLKLVTRFSVSGNDDVNISLKWEAENDQGMDNWWNPHQLHVLLLDDLLLAVTGVKARMAKAIASIAPTDLAEGPIKTLRNRLSRMRYIGRHTFIHDFIKGEPGKRSCGKLGKIVGLTGSPV